MIVKKIKYTKNTKPKEWQIGDLVDYIRNPSVRNRGEKIEHAGCRNFITDMQATGIWSETHGIVHYGCESRSRSTMSKEVVCGREFRAIWELL